MRKEIFTKNAPKPVGPYSQAVEANGFVFFSGQLGIDPKTNEMVLGGVEVETKQVMENLRNVLLEAGLDFSHVVRTDIFLKNISEFKIVNDIYKTYFTQSPMPARQTVEVSNMAKNALVEISCIAVKANS
jgi:2-iminobutanoate/2-iminopropanoate deaminase